MNTKPQYNAILAVAYIVLLVTGMNYASGFLQEMPDNMFMPMGMLALLVLSVAVMAYLFFYQPAVLILDGHREQAVSFFLKTVGTFAGATVFVIIVAVVLGSF